MRRVDGEAAGRSDGETLETYGLHMALYLVCAESDGKGSIYERI